MKLPPLNALRAFEAAARHLSFKHAAEELFVTPAAISYQIKTLEAFLGTSLFIRENRSILLTHAGQRCFVDIKAGFEQIAKGIDNVKKEQDTGTLVVSAGPAFTVKWLAPRLHDFIEKHPDIDARVSAGLGFLDLRHEHVDAAIRFGTINPEGLAVVSLTVESVVPMCHPELIRAKNGLKTPADLAQHTLIHDDSLAFAQQPPTWKGMLEKQQLPQVKSDKGIRFNQADHALQAAIDGSGVVLGRKVLATPDLNAGRLVMPFPEWEQSTELQYYFICLSERAHTYKINAFRQWVQGMLQPHSPNN